MPDAVKIRYVTAAQADDLRRRAGAFVEPSPEKANGFARHFGIVGVLATEYFIVPDDDPRLPRQAPDPLIQA